VDDASLRHGRVVAIHAWLPPVIPVGFGPAPQPELGELLDDVRTAAEALIADAVAKAVGDHATVPVEPRAVEGAPASVLIDAASDANLLVVGSRGYGGFVGLLLGSVSQHCVTHAPCPVLVHRVSG
jgi:nucleotide-binding universal stress UspA family protein